MKINTASSIFKMLANPIRLSILKSLSEGGELCVGVLEETVGSSQSSTSQHLAHLRNANILSCSKNGKKVCYRISDEEVLDIIKKLKLED